ncbi:Nucleolar complex protein 3-like protein [Operophtera brumata]|uniref:Nucleolar complex protein 3-like protein n=1 Tax=Operophtera brumata TaxID=104452 RepID=A0A0L7L0G0_OPEBR|nr:Nucleolar complex protein 3-like protein [Operophtera brumata]
MKISKVEYSSDSDSASGEEWADMLDEEEQKYIMSRLAKQPQLLSNVPEENSKEERKAPKRKRNRAPKQMTDESESEQETQHVPPPKKSKVEDHAQEPDSDSGMEGSPDEGRRAPEGEEGFISAVQLLAARRDRLAHEKLRIGALCSSLLESPEKKDGALNLHSVRKLASLSAGEVFRDILPDYMLRHQDYSDVKLKKDTLSLYKYEKELLEFYKRYLQRLEKAAGVLRRKKGDTRKPDESTVSLALVSIQCMASLLVARPNFNYSTNIAQSIVPFLDCRETKAREIVTEACVTIVRLINQLVKRRGERLVPSALDCLLTLKIRDIDMDLEADIKLKKKQEEKHKKRIVNLSKKEKKRNKKLKEVERELLETEAQESEMARRRQLTEVTRTVFHIYFRLLKTAPRSRLLAAALNGLAKFTHVINLEYYSDLVSILGHLLTDDQIAPREKLLCVRTVLAILAGSGDSLNVDPAKFHAHLYANMLNAHAGTSPSS